MSEEMFKTHVSVQRDQKTGELMSININWAAPGNCLTYIRPSGEVFYRGVYDKDYVETNGVSEHGKACLPLVRHLLTTTEVEKIFGLR